MSRETWLIRVHLPAGVVNGGRFMARLLKHLLRAWGVKCVALLDAAQETHTITQDQRSASETARPSSPTSESQGERNKH